MYASVLQVKFKPGTMSQAVETTVGAMDQVRAIDGIKQLISIDTGNDTGLLIATYESQAAQEAAGPKAREVLSLLADFLAVQPERKACEVLVNETF